MALIPLVSLLLPALAASAPATDEAAPLALDVVRADAPDCAGAVVVDRARERVRFEPRPDSACPPLPERAFHEIGSVRAHGCTGRLEIEWGDSNPVALAVRSGERSASVAGDCVASEAAREAEDAVDSLRDALGRRFGPETLLTEALEGRPLDASVAELASDPGAYAARHVRVRGRLEREAAGFRLAGMGGTSIALDPSPDAALVLGSSAHWVGATIEIVGRLAPAKAPAGDSGYVLKAADALGPEDVAITAVPLVALPAVAADPFAYQGKRVRVRGAFRGSNLYIDLPPQTRRAGGDWVVKADRAAAWVTGHAPGAQGFALDLDDPQASRHWVEIVGVPTFRNGALSIAATHVGLVRPPDGAHVAARRQIYGSSAVPAVIFTHPLAGDRLATDGVVVIQFNKQMDETTFGGRVRLAVEGGANDVATRLRYVAERNALIVKPVARLARGARVRLTLLPGIVDADGNPLRLPPRDSGSAIAYEVESE